MGMSLLYMEYATIYALIGVAIGTITLNNETPLCYKSATLKTLPRGSVLRKAVCYKSFTT